MVTLKVQTPEDHHYTLWARVDEQTTVENLMFLAAHLRGLPLQQLTPFLVDGANNHNDVALNYKLFQTSVAGQQFLCLHREGHTHQRCEAVNDGADAVNNGADAVNNDASPALCAHVSALPQPPYCPFLTSNPYCLRVSLCLPSPVGSLGFSPSRASRASLRHGLIVHPCLSIVILFLPSLPPSRKHAKQDFVFSRQWFHGQDGTYSKIKGTIVSIQMIEHRKQRLLSL